MKPPKVVGGKGSKSEKAWGVFRVKCRHKAEHTGSKRLLVERGTAGKQGPGACRSGLARATGSHQLRHD